MIVGEVFNLSLRAPVIVGVAIRKASYSRGLISESGEYMVNMPTICMREVVDCCRIVSGRQSGLLGRPDGFQKIRQVSPNQ